MSEKNCKLKKRKNVKQYWTLENGEIYYFSTYEPYPLPLIVNILNKMEDDTLMLEEENEQLRKELQRIEIIIQSKITETEEDLRTSIKGGMPTGGLYSEIEFLQKLKKECFDE